LRNKGEPLCGSPYGTALTRTAVFKTFESAGKFATLAAHDGEFQCSTVHPDCASRPRTDVVEPVPPTQRKPRKAILRSRRCHVKSAATKRKSTNQATSNVIGFGPYPEDENGAENRADNQSDNQVEHRHQRIAIAAYFKAEARSFEPGMEVDDWLKAEAEFARREAH
jgi:hypothetical protein